MKSETAVDGFPSDRQKEILEVDDRVVLVNAAPGSGKTELFRHKAVENIIKAEEGKGVLALSFSNAAKKVIEKRLSNEGVKPNFPHWIGTIDSFIYNFIVRPFGPSSGLLNSEGAVLISANLASKIQNPKVYYRKDRQASLTRINFYNGKIGEPAFKVIKQNRENEIVKGDRANYLLNEKKSYWQEKGYVTHSDCRYIAAKLLKKYKDIREILRSRFSVVLVDELQDIGNFHTNVIFLLIKSSINAFLVGDKDQAIYRFHGATGKIFNWFEEMEDCTTKPLAETFRFGQKLCNVSSFFRASDIAVSPSPSNNTTTHTVLLEHEQSMEQLGEPLSVFLKDNVSPDETVAILTRKHSFKDKLTEEQSTEKCPYSTRRICTLEEAVRIFRDNNAYVAYEASANILIRLIFERTSMDSGDFEDLGINYLEWKEKVFEFLQRISKSRDDETWGEWVDRIKDEVQQFAEFFGREESLGAIGHKFQKRSSDPNENPNDDPRWESKSVEASNLVWPEGTLFETVHGVKGDEFDVVCFVAPIARRGVAEPTNSWFSPDQENRSEEQNVAYVASTRARNKFILCLSSKSVENIKSLGCKNFIDKFDHKQLETAIN